MPRRKKASKKHTDSSKASSVPPQNQDCYEGERLASLLKSIRRETETARLLDGNALPEKIWFKQQFSIGVNDVTRVLERMAPIPQVGSYPAQPHSISSNRKVSSFQLQAVLLASDCNPRWLTKHLPSLASSRRVPLIYVKDKKGGSLRLGELVKLRTAIAIGVKAKGNAINELVGKILHGDEIICETNCMNTNETPDAAVSEA